MKILIVAHESEFIGGANRALFAILKYWSENFDMDINVLVPRLKGDFVDKLQKIGINCYVEKYYKIFSEKKNDGKNIFRYLKMYLKFLYNEYKAIKVSKVIKNEGFDLVYSNTRMTSIGCSIAKKLKIKHIMHIRELGEENTIWGPSSIKRIYKNSDKIITITEALKKELSQYVCADKFIVSYDGVIYQGEVKNEDEKNKERINLLLTGRISHAKGQDEAIKALNFLVEKGYNNIKLNLAGSLAGKTQYELEYKRNLEYMIDKFNLKNNIIFLGEVEDMRELRKKMDIELVCSKRETFGWVTVEGMRSELLVIGTNTGGTPEIIVDGKNGILYQQGNYQDLANKIEWALKNAKEVDIIRKTGYEFANNHFTIEKNANEVYQILQNVIGKGE